MPKGVEKNALGTYGASSGQASQAYGTLSPQLTQMATNPLGYSPVDRANMLTSSGQSIGGSIAGAVGQGNLEAARTNNAGGYAGALDDAARQGMVQNAQNALNVNTQNSQLKNQQQQFGLTGLDKLYGQTSSNALQGLSIADGASQATNNADMGWTALGLGTLAGAPGAVSGWKNLISG